MDSNINQLFNQTIDKMKSMVDVSVVVGKLMNFNGISVMPISHILENLIELIPEVGKELLLLLKNKKQ